MKKIRASQARTGDVYERPTGQRAGIVQIASLPTTGEVRLTLADGLTVTLPSATLITVWRQPTAVGCGHPAYPSHPAVWS